jgi:hypothetical protein
MRWPSEATSAKDAHIHIEVATVLLGGEIGSPFGGPEQRVERAVDPAGFINAGEIFCARIVVSGVQLLERYLVRRVAIDFVCVHENEGGLSTVLAGSLKQVDRSDGVQVEIDEGDFAVLVVKWLGGPVND